MNDLYSMHPSQIIMYSASWCPDCRRAREILDTNHIPYLEVDVDEDDEAVEFIKNLNRGFRSVPTIVFPDGSFLVEPSAEALANTLKK
jgi:mycoredoxin